MSEPIVIRSPFARAGMQFGWLSQYGSQGIGVQERYCQGSGFLEVRMGQKIYRMPKSLARQLHTRYNSTYIASGVLLYVLPLEAFKSQPVLEPGQCKLGGVA